MTNEEMVKLYQEGNKQALEELLEANKGIIHKVAYKFYTEQTASIDIDDLIQEGNIGLIIAAQKYDFNNEKKAQFSTYAVYWIYSKINRFMKYRNTNEEISLNKPNSEGIELGDTLVSEEYDYCSVEDSIYHRELNQELHQAMNKFLTLKQRQVLNFRYGFNCRTCSLKETGEIIGVTGSRVRQIENDGLRKLRKSSWGAMKIREHNIEFGEWWR